MHFNDDYTLSYFCMLISKISWVLSLWQRGLIANVKLHFFSLKPVTQQCNPFIQLPSQVIHHYPATRPSTTTYPFFANIMYCISLYSLRLVTLQLNQVIQLPSQAILHNPAIQASNPATHHNLVTQLLHNPATEHHQHNRDTGPQEVCILISTSWVHHLYG